MFDIYVSICPHVLSSSHHFYSICHCALDSVEEAVAARAAAKKAGTIGDDSAYLGLLYPTEEFKIYG